MPSVSKSQRQATAIALHHPEKLYERNKGLTKMNAKQLEDFASTSEKGLPMKKTSGKPPMGRGESGKKGSRKARRMGRSGGRY